MPRSSSPGGAVIPTSVGLISRTEDRCLDHPQEGHRWSVREPAAEAVRRNSAEEPESNSAEPGMPAAAPGLMPTVPPE